jgi:hypothetical protein
VSEPRRNDLIQSNGKAAVGQRSGPRDGSFQLGHFRLRRLII